MAEVKWIKITTDMFDNRKIKYIRTLPEGNNIVVIWVMLLTMAGRCNDNGKIMLTNEIPYDTGMLCSELGFEESIIKLSLSVFERLNMISNDCGAISINGWDEYQSVDKMERMKIQNANRQKKFRERLKIEENAENTSVSDDKEENNDNSNVTVTLPITQCNAIDIDIDKDIDKDKEKEKDIKNKDLKTLKPKACELKFADPLVEDVFKEFKLMRKKIRAPMTDRAERMARTKLERLATVNGIVDSDIAIAIAEQSVINDWKDFYPLKNQTTRNDKIKNRISEVDSW